MAVDLLLQNDTYVSQLRSAIGEGEAALSDVPGLLKCVLKDDRWRKRTIRTGDVVEFQRFEDFVRSLPLEGLGADMSLIRRICSDDKEALDLLDKALKHSPGPPPKPKPVEKPREAKSAPQSEPTGERTESVNIVNGSKGELRPFGNSSARAIRHLRESRPDLHAKVVAKELSPHAAMIEAGFRRKTITIPLEPASAARVLRRHFDEAQLRELARLLMSQEGGQ